jgi:hypothetical protein
MQNNAFFMGIGIMSEVFRMIVVTLMPGAEFELDLGDTRNFARSRETPLLTENHARALHAPT